MQRLPKELASVELTTTTAVLYTAPTNTRTTISEASVCNKTGTARYYTVTILSPGGSLKYKAFQVVVPAGKTVVVVGLIGKTFDSGGSLSAFAEANSALDFEISGYETNP